VAGYGTIGPQDRNLAEHAPPRQKRPSGTVLIDCAVNPNTADCIQPVSPERGVCAYLHSHLAFSRSTNVSLEACIGLCQRFRAHTAAEITPLRASVLFRERANQPPHTFTTVRYNTQGLRGPT
jgi:hypothetical protein